MPRRVGVHQAAPQTPSPPREHPARMVSPLAASGRVGRQEEGNRGQKEAQGIAVRKVPASISETVTVIEIIAICVSHVAPDWDDGLP